MTGKYIFYDLETTGKGKKESAKAFSSTPKWEQILQKAAIVTDENFQRYKNTATDPHIIWLYETSDEKEVFKQ